MEERVKALTKKPDVIKSNSIMNNQKTGFSQSNNSLVNKILYLQKTISNHAVQKLLKSSTVQDVNARAYTVGRDIVFGAEQYAPQMREEQRLSVHELTHVVQQCKGTVPLIQRKKESEGEAGRCIDDITKCMIKC